MRILLISSQSQPSSGGVDTFLSSLMSTLRSKGHIVDLLCFSDIKGLPVKEQLKIGLVIKSLYENATERITPIVGSKLYALQTLMKHIDISLYGVMHINCGISSFVFKTAFPSKKCICLNRNPDEEFDITEYASRFLNANFISELQYVSYEDL